MESGDCQCCQNGSMEESHHIVARSSYATLAARYSSKHIGAGLWFRKRSLGLLCFVGGVAGEVCNQELWNLCVYIYTIIHIYEFTLCCLVGVRFVLAKEALKNDAWATVGKSSSFRLLV